MEVQNRIKLFLYTVEEYKRFVEYFSLKKEHLLTDSYTNDEYIAIQTKLIILRKFGSKKDAVYIKSILNLAKDEFPEKSQCFNALLLDYDGIERTQLQMILPDGRKLNLYQTIEDVMYGLYLHADAEKIERLLAVDSTLRFSATRKYVESLETVILNAYDNILPCVTEKLEQKPFEHAPVIFLGDSNNTRQEITNSPYWTNLYGKNASDNELKDIFGKNSMEDNIILLICIEFIEEIRKENYSVKKLENLIFPPTRNDWGDFSQLHKMCKDLTNLGYSSRVRFNDKHDMAYVSLFRNIEGAFIIEQPHIIQDLCIITLVFESEKYGWRIFKIGPRAETYKETLSILESIKRILENRNKHK